MVNSSFNLCRVLQPPLIPLKGSFTAARQGLIRSAQFTGRGGKKNPLIQFVKFTET
jgi:hypothetical protein